ncbi:MAG TPA: sigma-E processing peptidase SpoIIGA [Bacillales bacterium]|nr:sigma-E processing peptidase SpoIIGA [Bacillales bacterium]
MTVYLDVVWLLNFLIDLLLLILTAHVLRRDVGKLRMLAGAFIASVFIFFLFSPYTAFLYAPVPKFFYSVFIVWTVFGYQRFYAFVQVVFMFYFITFVIGGGMFAFHYFMQGSSTILNTVLSHATPFGDVFSWAFVLIGFPCFWWFSKKRVDAIRVKKIHYDQMVSVEICVGDARIEAKGLIDSGNRLHDPLTQTPVMILQLDSFENEFPDALIRRARNPEAMFDDSETLPEQWQSRIRLIPYRGIGKNRDFLLAFKPDHVKLKQQNEEIVCKKVFVGLNEGTLSSEGGFNAIVHPKMMAANAKAQPAS